MKVGATILHELNFARGGSVERGLQLYVGAGNMPDDGGYGHAFSASVPTAISREWQSLSGFVCRASRGGRDGTGSE